MNRAYLRDAESPPQRYVFSWPRPTFVERRPGHLSPVGLSAYISLVRAVRTARQLRWHGRLSGSCHLDRRSFLLEASRWGAVILRPAKLVLITFQQRDVVSFTLAAIVEPGSKGDATQIRKDIAIVELLAVLP